jgi:hypothetical protein
MLTVIRLGLPAQLQRSLSKASSANFSVEVEQPDRPNVQTRMVVR